MQFTHLFWPPDRKLFRQRSRVRGLAPALVIMVVVVVAIIIGSGGGG